MMIMNDGGKSAGNQSCRHSTGDGLERLEAEFLCGNAELYQFGFVDTDGVVVGLGGMVDAVLQVFDGQVLVLDRVLHLPLDLFHQLRLQSGVLHQLVQLRLLLLQLLQLRLQLPRKDHIVHLSVFLDLSCEFIELVLEVLPVKDDAVILITEFRELLLDLDDLLSDGDEFALVVLATHLVLLELTQEGFEFVSFEAVLLEGVLEFVVGVPKFEDLLLVLLRLLVDALDFRLVLLDELEVVTRDLVVVVLQLREGLFVILHELVDVQVLPFFQLVDFDALLELEFFLHAGEFGLVVLLHLEVLVVVALHHEGLFALVVLLGDLGLLDVLLLLVDQVFLEVLLALLHVLHAVLVVLVLLDLGLLAVALDAHVRLLLLVLQQLQLLQKDLHLRVVRQLHVLALGLAVEDLGAQLLYFQLGVMVELLDHVAVHLNVVALGLDLAHLLLVQLQVAFQLGRNHLHELVIRLLLLLGPLRRHSIQQQVILCNTRFTLESPIGFNGGVRQAHSYPRSFNGQDIGLQIREPGFDSLSRSFLTGRDEMMAQQRWGWN